jgi:GTP diphosphokinase / guanosine-3',5'-bis(diphosphate) 3'-diphosphatase
MPAEAAAAHRPGDPRHLRAPGAPPRHAGDQAAARGPRVRGAAPQALRRDRPHGRHPHARARALPRPGAGRGAGRLAELGIEAEVTGRGKHLWSIYEKMVLKGREFDEIFDLVAVRVIVDSVKDCYAALGSIHGRWRPVQGRFKDYIAMPKFNLYQSSTPRSSGPMASRSRCRSAPARCTSGPSGASRRTGPTRTARRATDIDWLNRIIDWQAETSDPTQFMENLKTDLEQDEVFVFTPKGRVITLPVGATPVDFAYAVHTEVGHCLHRRQDQRSAGVARPPAPQRRHLRDLHLEGRDGGAVAGLARVRRVAAGAQQDPPVVQPRAPDRHDRGGPRRPHRRAPPRGLPVQRDLEVRPAREVVKDLSYGPRRLSLAIGEHHVSARSVAQRIAKGFRGGDARRAAPSTVFTPRRRRTTTESSGVHVEGLDDVLVRLANCCTPVPGDEIIGFVTRGRGVSVHRSDCANAAGCCRTRQPA